MIDSRHGLGLGRGSLTGHKMTHCQLWDDGPYDGSEGGPSERVAGRRSVVLPPATRSDEPLPDPSSRRHIVRPLGFESRWRKEICLCMGILSQFLRSKLCTERHLTLFCKLFNHSRNTVWVDTCLYKCLNGSTLLVRTAVYIYWTSLYADNTVAVRESVNCVQLIDIHTSCS